MKKWKTRVDGSIAQIGQHYQEKGSSGSFGAKRHASGMDLPTQPRSVDSMKSPGPGTRSREPRIRIKNGEPVIYSVYDHQYYSLEDIERLQEGFIKTFGKPDPYYAKLITDMKAALKAVNPPHPPSPGTIMATTLPGKSYTGEKLEYRGHIGKKGTELYVGEESKHPDIEDIVGSFERLPPSAQAQIDKLEIYSKRGKKRSVGGYEFHEGGHWSASEKTLRVFSSEEGKRWIGFQHSDDVVAHESGHALFDKLKTMKEPYPVDEIFAIEDQCAKKRLSENKRIMKEYEPQLEALWKDYQKKLDESLSFWGSAEEMKKKRREHEKVKRKLMKVQKERDGKLDEVKKKWDPQPRIAEVEKEKWAVSSGLKDFSKAGFEEGGITSYSQAWKAEPNFDTENFAECMKIFYSGWRDEEKASKRDYHREYPQTFRAFQNLVEPEVMGHAVSLKDKPRISAWEEFEGRLERKSPEERRQLEEGIMKTPSPGKRYLYSTIHRGTQKVTSEKQHRFLEARQLPHTHVYERNGEIIRKRVHAGGN